MQFSDKFYDSFSSNFLEINNPTFEPRYPKCSTIKDGREKRNPNLGMHEV